MNKVLLAGVNMLAYFTIALFIAFQVDEYQVPLFHDFFGLMLCIGAAIAMGIFNMLKFMDYIYEHA